MNLSQPDEIAAKCRAFLDQHVSSAGYKAARNDLLDLLRAVGHVANQIATDSAVEAVQEAMAEGKLVAPELN